MRGYLAAWCIVHLSNSRIGNRGDAIGKRRFQVNLGARERVLLDQTLSEWHYSLSYYRGLTSGFALSLVNTKDATGKSVTLTGSRGRQKLTYWSIFFAAFVGLIVVHWMPDRPALAGRRTPNPVLGFISFVVACFILILNYKIFLPIISSRNVDGKSASDETMVEVGNCSRGH